MRRPIWVGAVIVQFISALHFPSQVESSSIPASLITDILEDACRVESQILVLDVTAICQQFRNHSTFRNVFLVNAAPACNKHEMTAHGIYLRIPLSRYHECGFVPIPDDRGRSRFMKLHSQLRCSESTFPVTCFQQLFPEDNNNLVVLANALAKLEEPNFSGRGHASKVEKKRQLPGEPRAAPSPDYLEVPVTPKRAGNFTIQPPVVVLTINSFDRDVSFGETVDIGSVIKVMLKLVSNSSGSYGLRVQSLAATTGETDEFVESLVVDGCPTQSLFAPPSMLLIDRGTVEIALRAFRFPSSKILKFVGVVRACTQRCQKVHCNGLPVHRKIRQATLLNQTSSNGTTVVRHAIAASVKQLNKHEYEIVAVAAVGIRGYDTKYVVGFIPPARRSDAGHVSCRLIAVLAVALTGLLFQHSFLSNRQIVVF
ncbi:hypothetical protein BV898_09450 [Hypsibius exemplaris]|uniref:ZP domain-containing protein n=1 Tax=Hypsibius exemplaris TaxID=2072580 RepID=A0A1W0WML4_HYPEX|nr:hypothetical protein BV898_09450 [Hypsibius exemplaris]